ncbi:MAG: hypothetical protein PHQ95_04905, partial [Candidatus Gracilibacteria bacterium]|nr:hypothetical protein [Candidatus Gracilibacteria bacterium]
VSAALAFGLMFLGLVMGATSQGTTGDNGKLKSDVVNIETKDTTTTFTFGTGDKGITFTSIGLLDSESKAGISTALDIGKGVIGTIIMNILALGILWMAVMAALGSSKITEAAVAPIKGFGDEIGKLAMKAPQYVPIPLPGGKDKSITMAGVGSMGSSISSAISSAASKGGMEFGQSFGNSMASALGLEVNKTASILKALENDATNYKQTHDTKAQYITRNFETGKLDADGYAKDTISRHQLATNFEKVGIDAKLVEELKKADTVSKIGDVLHKIDDKELKGRLFKDKNGADSSAEIIEQLRIYTGHASESTPTVVSTFTAKNANEQNTGTISVHIENKPDISIAVEKGKINHDIVITQLKTQGITEKPEIDRIIKEIESELPEPPKKQ